MMNIPRFRKIIWKYYKEHGRTLPWRNISDPYKIFVSEVMLQQTQVSRVLVKYPEFIKKFPTIQCLARAGLKEVFLVWRGMGYNRRARYLRDAARIIVTIYGGVIPDAYDELKKLPGIGSGTAGSLLAFIYNKPVCFIETNIRRVIIHHFFSKQQGVSDRDIISIVEKTLDKKNPREWYYALMDYGSELPRKHGNANLRSAAYKKQSKFIGSDREIRGGILRLLADGGGLTYKRICNEIKSGEKRARGILNVLKKENLIQMKKNRYFLAD